MRRVLLPFTICALLVGTSSTALAQHRHRHGHDHDHDHDHHHHHGGARFRGNFWFVDPHGHHVHDHFDHYHYVVPYVQGYGSYYTYDNVHYFTPPAAPVVVGQRQVAMNPVAVEFGGYQHFEELAQRLEKLANQLCLDMHYNYRHNPGFRETYNEAYQMLQTAKFIHDSEHRGDREGIARQGDGLDGLFHHVQGDVAGWTRREHRRVGQLDLEGKMMEMEALIHHLLYDIGVTPSHDAEEEAPPPEDEQAPPPEALPPLTIEGAPPAFPRR